jgi:hypothetical protein
MAPAFSRTFWRTVLPRLWPVPFVVIVALLAGCSAAPIESTHFGASSEIERVIRLHYERHASEGGCFRPSIDGFTRLDVREDTPDRLVVDTRYFWRDRFQEGDGGQVCAGFNERTFTLARAPDGDPIVVEMTGEQDEPAIRSLIRRVLPNRP